MGAALHAQPYASLAWAASYITLQSLFDASPLPDEQVYAQILTVIDAMEWYVGLFRLVFWDCQQTSSPAVHALVALYDSVLVYHVRAAIQVAKHPKQVCLQWETDEIQDRTIAFIAKFSRLNLQPPVSARIKEAPVKEEAEPPELLSKLNVDHLQMLPSDTPNGHMLGHLFTLVSQTQAYGEFIQWDHKKNILWIRGGPGVGKSMFLQAFTQDVQEKQEEQVASYLCDRTKRRDDVLSVVKGLLYDVLSSQPGLRDHLEAMLSVDYAGASANQRRDFDAPGDFAAMSMLLCRLVHDRRFQATYFVVDGVDELGAKDDQADLLHLVSTTAALSDKVKWVLSVDADKVAGAINHAPKDAQLQLDLGQHLESDTQLAREYAVNAVAKRSHAVGYNVHVLNGLLRVLDNAPSNFLWTNMALDMVQSSALPWNAAAVLARLVEGAPTVQALYAWQWAALHDPTEYDTAFCEALLSLVAAAFRPLAVPELAAMADPPPAVRLDLMIVKVLPSFLTISENTVRFVHSSARDFVERGLAKQVQNGHAKIARRCLTLLLTKLGCGCAAVHDSLDGAGSWDDEVGYATAMWIQHLAQPGGRDDLQVMDLAVHVLSVHLIEWLQLLGPRNDLLQGLTMLQQLYASLSANTQQTSHDLRVIREAIVFLQLCQQGSTDAGWLDHQLLFATGLPTLQKILVPARFPWLEMPPAIGLAEGSASCLHAIPHNDWVRGCCFSPDGRLVASASDDRQVRVWDVQTGNVQACFGGLDDSVLRVAMANAPALHGRVLLAAASSGTIQGWDMASGESVFTLSGLPQVENMALSPCGNKLAAATSKGLVVWEDLAVTENRVQYSEESTICVAFSPDGNWIASTEGSTIRLWNAREPGTQPRTDASGHTDEIHGLAFSPDSRLLVSGSYDKTARVWDLETRQTVAVLAYHSSFIESVSFSPDGAFIATGSRDRVIAVWKHTSSGNWRCGETRNRPDRVLSGHTRPVWSVAFSPTSPSVLASASLDSSLRIWDTDTDTDTDTPPGSVLSHQQDICGMAITRDSNMMASASPDGMVCLWDGRTGEQLCVADRAQGHATEVRTMEFSPDGKLLATASIDGVALVWNVADAAGGEKTPLVPRLCLQHDSWVRDIRFDPQGQRMATACRDSRVRVFDVSQARKEERAAGAVPVTPSKAFEPRVGRVYSVAFSPDGRRLAAGGSGKQVCIWDVEDDEAEAKSGSDKVKSCIRSVAFADDGDRVVSVSMDGSMAVWTADASRRLRCRIVKKTWGDHIGPFRKMQFDPAYPGVLFTEHGLALVDLDKGVQRKEDDEAPARWSLPPSGVYKTSIKWNDHVIDLPACCRVEDEPFFWRLQGNTVVVGGRDGQIFLFRFREAAKPKPKGNRKGIW